MRRSALFLGALLCALVLPAHASTDWNDGWNFVNANKDRLGKNYDWSRMRWAILEQYPEDALKRVQCLVAEGTVPSRDECTLAIMRGSLPILKAIADRHSLHESAVYEAALYFRLAVNSGAGDAETSERASILEFLLDKGLNPNAREKKGGVTALMEAVHCRSAQATGLLLRYHADLSLRNEWEETALHLAAKYHESYSLEGNLGLLLSYIATMQSRDIASSLLDSQDHKGLSPLMVAVGDRYGFRRTNVMAVKKLIAAGADVHVQDYAGETALMRAVKQHDEDFVPEVLALLLSHGSDLSLCNKAGQTAYDMSLGYSYAIRRSLRPFPATGMQKVLDRIHDTFLCRAEEG